MTDVALEFVDPCTHSEEQQFGSSPSPILSNSRSTRPPDSPADTLRSFHEMDDSRETDVLAPPRSVSPGISDAEGALNVAQLHTSPPSSSSQVYEGRAKGPRFNTTGVLAWADPDLNDSLANSAIINHVDDTANQSQSPCQPATNQITPASHSPPSNDSSEQSFLEGSTDGSLSNDLAGQSSDGSYVKGVASRSSAMHSSSGTNLNSEAVDILSPGSDTYSHRFHPSVVNQPSETISYTGAEELEILLDEQSRKFAGQSELGLPSETHVYAPGLHTQLTESPYDPRFNIQPIDLLYDPRFNIQPIEPLYDPRFNIQPIDLIYDPQFNIQPMDPLCDPCFNLQPVGLHDSRFNAQPTNTQLEVQQVLDPQFSAQSSHFHQSSFHTQQITPSIQNDISAFNSGSPDLLAIVDLSNPHETRSLSSSARLTRVLDCSA